MEYITPDNLRRKILDICTTYFTNSFQYKTPDLWKQMNQDEFSTQTEKLFQELQALVSNEKYPHTFESTANEISKDYPLLKPVLNELFLQEGNRQKSGELILRQLYNYHRII
ncbi:hypothetical protein [Bacillus sp. 1NLA3E]|uniref:hypothetical protein n=1 Tax=Bacillus sp. 1NLA3E TaxID=666686 RepID=UPI000247F0E2|nr:hypothetical protein [Bacillus sp. 1NLA3E]AGK53628.1 hypothetical protein B1NLA3E_09330 [Bacillus sp. 1NLA3E]